MYHEHSFAFPPSAVSVMPLSQERILRWSYLRLDQSAYHSWLSMMTSSEGPPFLVLSRAPPTLNPPLRRGVGVYSSEAGAESESKVSDSVHLWNTWKPLAESGDSAEPGSALQNRCSHMTNIMRGAKHFDSTSYFLYA